MIVIVTGGRNYADACMVRAVLSELDPRAIWHGGASGADRIAADYAELWGEDCTEFKADWKRHGRAAGPMRNQHMIDCAARLREFALPDECEIRVVAFPGGRGTADCVKRAREAGLDVIEVTDSGYGEWTVTHRNWQGITLRKPSGETVSVAADGHDVREFA
jgi:hypothetical protein